MFSALMHVFTWAFRKSATAGLEPDPMYRPLNELDVRERLLYERAVQEGGGNPMPMLFQTLDGDDEVIKATAVQLLGDIGPRLPDDETRRMIIEKVVVILGLPSGSDPDRRSFLRMQAALALGKFRDPATVPALIEALKTNFIGLRRSTAWALGEI